MQGRSGRDRKKRYTQNQEVDFLNYGENGKRGEKKEYIIFLRTCMPWKTEYMQKLPIKKHCIQEDWKKLN